MLPNSYFEVIAIRENSYYILASPNNVLIFLEHISTLCALPSMDPADANLVRGILDTVSALRGSLLSLGSETNIINVVLIHNVP